MREKIFFIYILCFLFINLPLAKAVDKFPLTPEIQSYIEASKNYLLSTWVDKCIYLSLDTSPYTYTWRDRSPNFFNSRCLAIYTTEDFGVKPTYHFALLSIDTKNGTYQVASTKKGKLIAGNLEPLIELRGKKVIYDIFSLLNALVYVQQDYYMAAPKNWIWVPVDLLGLTKKKNILTPEELSQKILNIAYENNQNPLSDSFPDKNIAHSTFSEVDAPSSLSGWSYVNESLLCDQRQGYSKDECYKLIQDLKSVLPNPWHIYGDFNGDKIGDEAGLMINKNEERRLYVFLGKPQGPPEPILLHDVGKLEEVDLYVALVKPGKTENYCEANKLDPSYCDPDEPKIDTPYPRIAFGLFEATEVDFYWNDATKKFESTNVSD